MAKVFREGAESGDTLFFNNAGAATASATQKRSGSYAYTINSSTCYRNISALSSGYFREGIWWDWTGATSSNNYVVGFRNSTTMHVGIYFNSTTSKFGVNAGGVSSVAESTHTFNKSVWWLLEVYVNIGGSGSVIVKVDGIEEINWSGDTQNGATTTFDNIAWYEDVGATQMYWDDMALNDTTGGSDNSWCGDGHIEYLTPNGNGDTNNWTGSDGDSTDNYLHVDEAVSDGDTTYVKSLTNGQQDMYNLAAFDDTNKVITCVWVDVRAKDNSSSSGQIKIGVKTGGSVYLSSARTLTGSYSQVVGDYLATNPADSQTWEDADIEALQLVVECQ